ncbi:hypothetical protein GOV13_04640 [Candidatus Pacearchaeota archaeon]|nr:hypothetical protein [Candidatus Pacearchaeota archaeon]
MVSIKQIRNWRNTSKLAKAIETATLLTPVVAPIVHAQVAEAEENKFLCSGMRARMFGQIAVYNSNKNIEQLNITRESVNGALDGEIGALQELREIIKRYSESNCKSVDVGYNSKKGHITYSGPEQ